MTIRYIPKIDALASFGAYSPVSMSTGGDLVALAGQVGTNADGSFEHGADTAHQVRAAFDNLGKALAAVGLDFQHVLKFNTFLVGRETIPDFMDTRKKVFAEIYPNGEYPPNTLLLVSGLVEERFVVEIEALAVRPAEGKA